MRLNYWSSNVMTTRKGCSEHSFEFFAINNNNNCNVGIKGFYNSKEKHYPSGTQPDDHWIKGLMLILLS